MRSMETIGQRIRRLRESKGLTSSRLAQRVGRSQTAVANWESGQSYPGGESIRRLCRVLGVSMEQLTGGGPAQPPWPFDQIDEQALARLDQRDIDMLQGALLLAAAQIGVEIGKG